MIYDLQKASIMKRIAAGIFDFIFTAIIAVGIMWALSAIFNYDGMSAKVDNCYEQYATEYGVDFRKITEEEYNKYTPEQQAHYKEVYDLLIKDQEFLKAYNLMLNFTLVMITMGLLVGILVVEFVIPMFLGNGQTIGKKCFGICLMMQNGVKIRPFPLLARSLLGKFTIEAMIPCYILVMFLFGTITIIQILILIGLVLLQLALIITNRFNTLIHDSLSFTCVVDKESQMIFNTEDDLIKYKEKLAKDEAKKRTF